MNKSKIAPNKKKLLEVGFMHSDLTRTFLTKVLKKKYQSNQSVKLLSTPVVMLKLLIKLLELLLFLHCTYLNIYFIIRLLSTFILFKVI